MAVKGGLKFLRKRVRAIQNLKKVTKAMKSVSSVRLRKSQPILYASDEFIKNMEKIFKVETDSVEGYEEVFSIGNEGGKKLYIVLGSDKGLCGAFNSNIARFAQTKIEDNSEIWIFGRRIARQLSRKFKAKVFEDFWRTFSYENFDSVYNQIKQKVESGEISEIYCIYTFFKSTGTQYPVIEKIFPVKIYLMWERKRIIEPSSEELLRYFLFAYMKAKLFYSFQSSLTSEHAARMRAMDMATQNAERLQKQLVLQMNKARQEAITKELIDIVSGKNALEAQSV